MSVTLSFLYCTQYEGPFAMNKVIWLQANKSILDMQSSKIKVRKLSATRTCMMERQENVPERCVYNFDQNMHLLSILQQLDISENKIRYTPAHRDTLKTLVDTMSSLF